MAGSRRVIGVDESGKGDFFGPLVIAAFLADDAEADKLVAGDVRDSKKIANNKLLTIDEALRARYPHKIVTIFPSEYNDRYEKIKNLNKLLAEGHAEAITDLHSEHPADLAISDKFGKTELIERQLGLRGCDIDLKQLVRGERIIQVAAASILARAAFLRAMEALSEEFAVHLPLGAAPQVDQAGREFLKIHPVSALRKVAKLHFKNYNRVINPGLFV